jgi:flagellum-specific peptidoglycan hydrolase FlgJ
VSYTPHVAKNAALPTEKRLALATAITAAAAARAAYPKYPKALLPVQVAQFLLESAWGKSDCGGAKNYFGIKARPGEPYVERRTREVIKGQEITVLARFKKYDSMAESFADHARLLCERRWSAASGGQLIYRRALEHPNDPIAFARALQGVYATDPKYGDLLVGIMRSRGLLETFGFTAAAAA